MPAPSICAASSTSFGMPAKKLCMIQTANDRLNAALTRIIAAHVSRIPRAMNWRNRPDVSTAGCTIWVTITRNRNTSRPGNRNRAV